MRSLSLCETDIHVEVPRVEYDRVLSYARGKPADDRLGEPSADIRTRVEKAREAQRQQFIAAQTATNDAVDPIGASNTKVVPERGRHGRSPATAG